MPRRNPLAVAVSVLVACALLHAGSAHTPDEWKSRSIYQVITDRFSLPPPNNSTAACANIHSYCGGTWSGIASRLDYIQSLGFNAIWISPVPENTPDAFHGYSALNLYRLNPYFGTEQDFIDMIAACHARDIWVMVDVVGNHMASVGFDFSQLVPFNQSEYFHDCSGGCDSSCSIPDSAWPVHNATVIEHCRLETLTDLDQDNAYVRATLLDWIDSLVHSYAIDGLRIDTAPEVKPAFWVEWQARAGVYAFGEVFDSDVQYVAQYQGPLDATLSYPLFFAMRNVWAQGQSMHQLWDLFNTYDTYFKGQQVQGEVEHACLSECDPIAHHDLPILCCADPTILGTFIDNHDNGCEHIPTHTQHTHAPRLVCVELNPGAVQRSKIFSFFTTQPETATAAARPAAAVQPASSSSLVQSAPAAAANPAPVATSPTGRKRKESNRSGSAVRSPSPPPKRLPQDTRRAEYADDNPYEFLSLPAAYLSSSSPFVASSLYRHRFLPQCLLLPKLFTSQSASLHCTHVLVRILTCC